MASKLYPTLSTFYKAGNVGFGSEHDAMLCGVPEEKLYRKSSKQRGETSYITSAQEQSRPNAQISGEIESPDANINSKNYELPQNLSAEEPLIPSAPPLLEMLDLRLQQYLNMLLTPDSSGGNIASTPVLLGQDNQPVVSVSTMCSDPQASSQTGPTATITLPLPPNVFEESWLDEIRPDYDDLTPEQTADEILNNLNLSREEDTKDHEKRKSMSLLRPPVKFETGRPRENEESIQRKHRQPYYDRDVQQQGYHRHNYQKQQSSQSSREDNADIDDRDQHQQQQNHQQRQRNTALDLNLHRAGRLQGKASQSHDDVRQIDRLKRSDSVATLSHDFNHKTAGVDKRRHGVYPHCHRVSQHHTRHESGQPKADRRESGKSHRKTLAGAGEDDQRRSPGRAEESQRISPGKAEQNSDYNAWMTWRKQVNRQLATIILLKQQGKSVTVQTTDMRRKPLRQSSIDFVSQIATQSGSTTSLGGKPYVMYGIPRASLLLKSENVGKCGRES